MRAQPVTVVHAYDELIVNVCPARCFDRQTYDVGEASVGKQRAIARRVALTGGGPRFQVRQLDTQHGGLQCIETKVPAHHMVVILRLHAVIAQQPDAPCQLSIRAGDKATIAEPAEILARKKRETAERTKAPDLVPVVGGADRLCRILDDECAGLHRGVDDRMQVGRLAKQVHRNNRLGPRRHGGRDRVRIDVEGVGLYINQHRLRANTHYAPGTGKKGIRAGDDLVARPDAERHQRGEQRVGAR
jgi:hypothetical protein